MRNQLKTLILKVAIFLIVCVAYLSLYVWYYYHDDKYQNTVSAKTVYRAIKKSKQTKKVKKVILGDSVANQLFPNAAYNDSIYSLTANNGSSFPGWYILLKNFLDNNRSNPPEEVIVIFHPTSLANDLNEKYTYNDLIKPFYSCEYKDDFSELANAQIHKLPYYYLSQFPVIKIGNWAPPFNREPKSSTPYISAVSTEYLLLIRNLCDSLNISLALFPPPVNNSMRDSMAEVLPLVKTEASAYGLGPPFEEYIQNINYLDSELFKDDRHLKQPHNFNANYILQDPTKKIAGVNN